MVNWFFWRSARPSSYDHPIEYSQHYPKSYHHHQTYYPPSQPGPYSYTPSYQYPYHHHPHPTPTHTTYTQPLPRYIPPVPTSSTAATNPSTGRTARRRWFSSSPPQTRQPPKVQVKRVLVVERPSTTTLTTTATSSSSTTLERVNRRVPSVKELKQDKRRRRFRGASRGWTREKDTVPVLPHTRGTTVPAMGGGYIYSTVPSGGVRFGHTTVREYRPG